MAGVLLLGQFGHNPRGGDIGEAHWLHCSRSCGCQWIDSSALLALSIVANGDFGTA